MNHSILFCTLVLLISLTGICCDDGRANYQCTYGTIAFNIVFGEPVKGFFARGKYETCGTNAKGEGSFTIKGNGTKAAPYEGQIKPSDEEACGNVRSGNGYRNITLIATKNAGVVHIDDYIVYIECQENETLSITKTVSFGTSSSTPGVQNVPGITANTKMKIVDGNQTDAAALKATGLKVVVLETLVRIVVEFDANPILKDYLVVDCRASPTSPGKLVPIIDKYGCPSTAFKVYTDNTLLQKKQLSVDGTVSTSIVLPAYKSFRFPQNANTVTVTCTLLLCLDGETHCKLDKCPASTSRRRRGLDSVKSATVSTEYRVLTNDSLVTEVVEDYHPESRTDWLMLAAITASVGTLVLICVIGWIVCLKITRRKPADEKSQNPN